MTIPFRLAGMAFALAAALALACLSQVPIDSRTGGQGVLRLTWRARPDRVEQCVTQSPEVLARLPAHMRQATVCEGVNASYVLEVRRDNAFVARQTVTPGGLRRDRPLYVFRDIVLPADEATITVTFVRVESRAPEADDDRQRDRLRETVPASLAFQRRMSFEPGQVRIISYDPTRQVLFEIRPD